MFNLQSISAPGSGIWSDGKDKSDGAQAHTWNVEVLIDVLKELVSFLSTLIFSAEQFKERHEYKLFEFQQPEWL